MSATDKKETQPASVDELVTTFKRRGHFDALRKSTFSSFQASPEGEKLIGKLRDIVRAEVEKDPNILSRDRSKSSILIGGAVDRARVFDTVRRDRDAVLDEHNVYDDIKIRVTTLLAEANGNGNASEGGKSK